MKTLSLLLLLYGITAVYAQESCSTEGSVRLRSLSDTNPFPIIAGRVEFCRNGVWGTVCGDSAFTPWSEKNAQVVCRDLGFSGALNSILHDRIPLEARASTDTPIHLRNVSCLGHESALDDCVHIRGNTTCTHDQDVAITCRPNLSANGEDGENEDVFLVGNASNGHGAVLLRDFRHGFIGICPDDSTFDTVEANIVCRQLGYDSGSVMEYSVSIESTVRAQGFSCGSEDTSLSIATCNYWVTSECSSSMLMGVACVSSNVPAGTIRLFEGRVEIFFNGKWGLICGSDWDNTDGEVACRELGFGTDSVSTSTPAEDLGASNRIRPIWLNQLDCLSTFETLNQCPHLEPTGYADCYSSSRTFAALNCDPEGGENSGGVAGIVIAVIVVVVVIILAWVYGKENWSNRERYPVYRCLVWPCRACNRCLDNCSASTQNTNTGGAPVVFSLNRNTATTHSTETTANRPRSSTSESAPEVEPEHNEEQPELTKTAPPSYLAASHLPTADPTDLPPPYPGPPEAGYPTAPGAYPPPTGGASYPPVGTGAYPPMGVGVYPPGVPAYPPGGDLAYPPAAIPGAGLQGYPPPTQAGAPYPPTLEPAYPPATNAAPYPVETPQQHAPLDPVLAEELAHVPQGTAPTLDQQLN